MFRALIHHAMTDVPIFQIRQANEKDAERLAAIGVETFKSAFGHLYPPDDFLDFASTYHSPEAYRRILTNENCRAWIAEAANGETVGYAVSGPCSLPVPDLSPNSGELKRIYLNKGIQGSGIGARLMTAALEFLRTRFDRVYLGVYSENFSAHRFYERFGFVKIADYVFMVGKHEDAEWIMELKEPKSA